MSFAHGLLSGNTQSSETNPIARQSLEGSLQT